MRKLVSAFLFMLPCLSVLAQETGNEANSGLRADGKIWVVLAICVTILAGLLFYLWRIDRKVSALEK